MKVLSQLLIIVFSSLIGCTDPVPEMQVQESESIGNQQVMSRQSVVFIAGFDQGDNQYYNNARAYFENTGMQVVEDLFSLEEIIYWLDQNHKYKNYDEIHVVSHSNPWLGMALKTTKDGERITEKGLRAIKEEDKLPLLDNYVNKDTKVIFHSCGLGENQELLEQLKTVFTVEQLPQVYASSFFNVFGGKYAGHYLAKPYYGYYPTAESPGPRALAAVFENKYPNVNINWFTALKTRKEERPGQVYTYRFNIPVTWEFVFENAKDIPKLQSSDQIMDWIVEQQTIASELLQLGIPIEKYRWRNRVRGNTLQINGKTTVLSVLQPIMDSIDGVEYRQAKITDTSLYQIL